MKNKIEIINLAGEKEMKSFLKGNNKETLMEYFYAVAGCLIYAVGFNMLIVPLGYTVAVLWDFLS